MTDQTTQDDESIQKTGKNKRGKLVPILVLLLLISAGVAIYMTAKYQHAKKNPQSLVQADQNKLINKVGALIDLPQGETPSIATVSDKNKLQSQAFFKNAQNGDTLLIYTNAKKAILYRESTNKIVEVAPIAIDTTAAGTTPQDATKK